MRSRSSLLVLAVLGTLLAALITPAYAAAPEGTGVLVAARAAARVGSLPAPREAAPLAGRTIVLDPGHQLGNGRFPREVNAPVDAGGFTKPCNSTGTATDAGYPEATFAWQVVTRVREALRRLGARVVLTRSDNSASAWGPCVDARGRLGNAGYRGRTKAADLKLSVHGDGSAGGNHGFHVIIAAKGSAYAASRRYALGTRAALQAAGFARSSYIGGGTALSVRSDLATLNLSAVPTAMVELGNMRNAGDASVMSSAAGQQRYATALVAAARAFLAR